MAFADINDHLSCELRIQMSPSIGSMHESLPFRFIDFFFAFVCPTLYILFLAFQYPSERLLRKEKENV